MSLPNGRRKYLYGGTREEVRRKLARALGAQETGSLGDARGRTLGEFLDEWLRDIVRPSVAFGLIVGTKSTSAGISNRLLGGYRLSALSRLMYRHFLTKN